MRCAGTRRSKRCGRADAVLKGFSERAAATETSPFESHLQSHQTRRIVLTKVLTTAYKQLRHVSTGHSRQRDASPLFGTNQSATKNLKPEISESLAVENPTATRPRGGKNCHQSSLRPRRDRPAGYSIQYRSITPAKLTRLEKLYKVFLLVLFDGQA